jgi:hypothetical protein
MHNRQVTTVVKKKKRKIEAIKTQKIPSFDDFIFENSSNDIDNLQNLIEEEKKG